MEVIVAETLGFCFGVKMSVDKAEKAVKDGKPNVQILGPIVHNPQQVKALEDQGITKIDELTQAKPGTILIRAHGVPPETMTAAYQVPNAEVIDATCPLVKIEQNYAKTLFDEGYKVIIVGEHGHPEALGVSGFTGHKAIIIENEKQAEELPFQSKKVGVVIQTTLVPDKVDRIIAKLFHKTHEMRIFNTICAPTKERQPAAVKTAHIVDVMVIVGGKNSSNTKRLAEVCEEIVPTYHVEYPSEIKTEWFTGKKKVGVSAGASTPDFVIQETIEYLQKLQPPNASPA
ncbi:MAG TPA: 4-hydroxy-3-methylbut-2-enyl diphosphate reductase [Candidatus Norongarragalinales archaeon]|jgi:4-hydroxy-3-methylbut-2-enyl diphosphate reductase|nr:4-hydroxy-3-methylbut-2-enyl diphosphate reductase [Candidatus Norongarragalinales archaeon]